MALLAIVIAAVAVILVARGDDRENIHMLVATALGVGLTVLLGTGVMTLTFLSSSNRHDQQAGRSEEGPNQ